MTVNPGALLLLVIGFVALVVGVKGTQGQVGQLLTGRPDAGTGAAADPTGTPPHPTQANPMGSAPHLQANGSLGPVGPLGP